MKRSEICILVGVFLLSSFSFFNIANAYDLVGHWKFDEGYGLIFYDSSGYSNSATFNGETFNDGTINGATYTASGKYSTALTFNGINNYLNCGNTSNLQATSFTATSWFKTGDITSDVGIIFMKGDVFGSTGQETNYGCIKINGGYIRCYFEEANSTDHSSTSTNAYNDSTWHFVSWSKNSTHRELRIDYNTEIVSALDASTPATNIMNLTIGAHQPLDRYWNGSIDDVRIYNRSLSDSELSNIYNYNTFIREGLVSYWKFDEGSGTTAYDTHHIATRWNTNGTKYSNALNFDGVDDNARLGATTDIFTESTFSGGQTIALWIRPASWKASTIFDIEGRGGLIEMAATGKVRYYTYDNDYQYTSYSTDALTTENWWFVVAVWNTTHNLLYINGVLDNSAAAANYSSINDVNRYVAIGSKHDGTAAYFNGTIDDARIYSRGLTSSEIESLYNNTQPRYSSITTSSPSTYSNTSYSWMNVTWNDESAGLTVNIESDYSGTPTNYTPTNIGNVYYLKEILPAGSFYWKTYANNSIDNLNQSTQTFSIAKLSSGLSMSITPAWQVYNGQSFTISCSASPNVTLMKDSYPVSLPYTSTLGMGSYNMTCFVDGQNYSSSYTTNILNVMAPGIGCINTSSYIYTTTIPVSTNEITLDFTTFVSQGIVNPSLSDIFLLTSNATGSTQINSTTYLFLVNSSNVSSFSLGFGNAFATNSWSNITAVNNTLTSFVQTQLAQYYYTVNILNEINGSAFYPFPNATASASIVCNAGSNTYNISRALFYFPTVTQLDSVSIYATYSPTSFYYRNLLATAPIQYMNFYMTDAMQYQVIQIILDLQDNTGTFSNSILKITKKLGSQEVTITQLYFDTEKKAVVYLQNGGVYKVYVSSGTETRGFGDLIVDNVNLEKKIMINSVILTDVQKGNVTYDLSFDNSTGLVTFVWYDPYSNMQWVNMTIYNNTDNSIITSFSSQNSSKVSYSYTVPTVNQTYRIVVSTYNSILGLSIFNRYFSGIIALFPAYGLPAMLPSGVVIFGCAILIISMPMFFDERAGAVAGIMASLVGIFLTIAGWWPGGATILTIGVIALILSIIDKIGERRYELD